MKSEFFNMQTGNISIDNLSVVDMRQSNLSKSLSVGTHVSHDNENVFLTLIGQELGCGQCNARRDDTLNAASHKQPNTVQSITPRIQLTETCIRRESNGTIDGSETIQHLNLPMHWTLSNQSQMCAHKIKL